MRTFYDSVTPAGIPIETGLDGVIGYANGRFAWTRADERRFLTAGLQLAHVDVNGTDWNAAAILDVERGDATPQAAPGWVARRNTFRGDATIYCNLSTLPAVLAAMRHTGEHWWLWIAHFTGHPHIPPMDLPDTVRVMGCQFASLPDIDKTCVVADDWHPRTIAA